MKTRYRFYIDGFNVYYALNHPLYRKYKWLDYMALAKSVLPHIDTCVAGVYYFSTYVGWKPDSKARHKDYVKALRSVDVSIVLGRFMAKTVRCHKCGQKYKTKEEKQTDVNIAISLLSDAVEDQYDKAVIVSADTDLIPTIEAVHKLRPDKEIGVMLPLRRPNNSLQKASDFVLVMTEKLLAASQFPDEISLDGSTIKRPTHWV